MKLFVTGGAGFIGSNFIHHVLELPGYEVVNFDALTYAGNLKSLSDLSGNSRYRFVKGDITSTDQVESAIEPDTDAVVNFAAETHVDRSILGLLGLRPNQYSGHSGPVGVDPKEKGPASPSDFHG